jgi:hypothetical protein
MGPFYKTFLRVIVTITKLECFCSIVRNFLASVLSKHYEFKMNRFCNKLVCLLKQICLSKTVKVTKKDTSLLRNLSISHKLRIYNVL